MHLLTIEFNREDLEKILPLLYRHIHWGWEEKANNTVVIHFSVHKPALDFMDLIRKTAPGALCTLQQVHDRDWTREWRQFFTPREIDQTFVILPEWLKDNQQDLVKIIITPKMAFGTGHHPTTALCLKTLSSLFRQGVINREFRFLDLGTGSGILGIAAARLGLSGTGLDIDPVAVDNARENIVLNQVQDRFSAETGDVCSLAGKERFNLILANILASTLKDLAREIIALLDTDRYCLILSGILEKQAQDVTGTYREQGLGSPLTQHEKDWVALIWTNMEGGGT